MTVRKRHRWIQVPIRLLNGETVYKRCARCGALGVESACGPRGGFVVRIVPRGSSVSLARYDCLGETP